MSCRAELTDVLQVIEAFTIGEHFSAPSLVGTTVPVKHGNDALNDCLMSTPRRDFVANSGYSVPGY